MLKKEYVLTETRDLLFPIVEPLGYIKRGHGDCVLKQKNLVSVVHLDTTYYSYGIAIFCGLQHFHLPISKVVSHLGKIFPELKYDNASQCTFNFKSYESHQKRCDEYGFFYKGKKTPTFVDKWGIFDTLRILIPFLEEEGLPVLKKYEDLFLINNEINSKDFWTTDWGKEYNLGAAFSTKRLAIAHFCSNPNFDTLFDFHHQELLNELEDGKEKTVQWQQAEYRLLYLRDYLKTLPRL